MCVDTPSCSQNPSRMPRMSPSSRFIRFIHCLFCFCFRGVDYYSLIDWITIDTGPLSCTGMRWMWERWASLSFLILESTSFFAQHKLDGLITSRMFLHSRLFPCFIILHFFVMSFDCRVVVRINSTLKRQKRNKMHICFFYNTSSKYDTHKKKKFKLLFSVYMEWSRK